MWCRNMNACKYCDDHGIVLLGCLATKEYSAAACVCTRGQWYRQKWQLRAWAALQRPQPTHIGRLEDFYDANELRVLETNDGPAIAVMLDAVVAERIARG